MRLEVSDRRGRRVELRAEGGVIGLQLGVGFFGGARLGAEDVDLILGVVELHGGGMVARFAGV